MNSPSSDETAPWRPDAKPGSDPRPEVAPPIVRPADPQDTVGSAEIPLPNVLADIAKPSANSTVSSVELSVSAVRAAAQQARSSQRTVGRYQILHELGSGGMGTVYKAYDPQLERTVALKVIRRRGRGYSRAMRQQFLREARAVAKLEGANGIISVLDHNFDRDDDDELFFTMRVIDSGTLRGRMAPAQPWAPVDAVAVIQKLARAIQQVHNLGVVHRDLKPENVLIDPAGEPWVTDFGIAWSTDAAHAAQRTDRDAVAGTLNYMAPEQVQGIAVAISPQTDVYALGLILYELLTGRLPFVPRSQEPDPIAWIERAIIQQAPFPPSAYTSDVPEPLDSIVLKCLAKEPSDRYESASALAEDLDRLLDGQSVAAETTSIVREAWRVCRRYPGIMGLLVGTAAQFLVGGLAAVAAWPTAWGLLRRSRVLPERVRLASVSGIVGGGIGIAAAVILWLGSFTPAINDWERRMQDAQFHYRGMRTSQAPVVIVALDRASLDELTEPMVFLSPKLGTAIRYLTEQGATAIGLDFMIPSGAAGGKWLQPGEPGDAEELGRAVGESGRVVLPVLCTAADAEAATERLEPIPQWLAKHFVQPEWNDLGAVNLSADGDQVLRSQTLHYEEGPIPHLALAVLGRHRQWDDSQAAQEIASLPARAAVNYVGPPGTLPMVSFREVLAAANGKPTTAEFRGQWRGRMVLIGTTDLSLGDRHLTPYSRRPPIPLLARYDHHSRSDSEDEWMAGVELQGNIVATLHDRAWIRKVSDPVLRGASMVAIGAALGWLAARRRLVIVLATAFAAQLSWWLINCWMFQFAGVSIPLVATWLVCMAAPGAVLMWRSGHKLKQPPSFNAVALRSPGTGASGLPMASGPS